MLFKIQKKSLCNCSSNFMWIICFYNWNWRKYHLYSNDYGFGLPPLIASSTSMFLVMYSAAANTISYSVSGKLSITNGLWLGVWTSVGVVLGVFGANKIIQKTGRQSIFIFVLSLLLVLSIVCTIIFDIVELVDDISSGNFAFELGDFWNKFNVIIKVIRYIQSSFENYLVHLSYYIAS